jgi:RNA polymerase sigma-70 factor, ECF subfamily
MCPPTDPRVTTNSYTNNEYAQMNNVQLTVACQSGDKTAYTHLLRRLHSLITFQTAKYAAGGLEVEDLRQEVQVRVWKSLKSLRRPESLDSWLNTIVHNMALDMFRRKAREAPIKGYSLDEPITFEDGQRSYRQDLVPASNKWSAEQQVDAVDQLTILIPRLKQLNPNFIRPMMLQLDGYTYEEIAKRENCRTGTIKSRIARGHRAARAACQDDF